MHCFVTCDTVVITMKLTLLFLHRICQRFEEIAEKALTTPANTEELVELEKYIKGVSSQRTILKANTKRIQDDTLTVNE